MEGAAGVAMGAGGGEMAAGEAAEAVAGAATAEVSWGCCFVSEGLRAPFGS